MKKGKSEKTLFAILMDPDFQLSIFMIGFLGYSVLPALVWFELKNQLDTGVFPVNADSIGLPFGGFLLLWLGGLILIPIIILVVALWSRSDK